MIVLGAMLASIFALPMPCLWFVIGKDSCILPLTRKSVLDAGLASRLARFQITISLKIIFQ